MEMRNLQGFSGTRSGKGSQDLVREERGVRDAEHGGGGHGRAGVVVEEEGRALAHCPAAHWDPPLHLPHERE